MSVIRAHLQSIAVAFATFSVVTGGIVGVGLMTAEPVEAQLSAGLAGQWTGGYISSDGADVNTFDVKLKQSGPALTGTITEVNTFGDRTRALFLTSTLVGNLRGRNVSFTKTYDGAGGASHSVEYNGELDASGRRIRGEYNAEGVGGVFEMVR